MDVDESNNALIAANVTNEFETQQAIPETDCYRISKCYTEFKEHGGVPDTTALSNENILEVIDNAMMTMTEAEVPIEGRILYVTPTMEKNINEAKEIQRYISLNQNTGNVNRKIVNLDGLKIKPILSARMKTIYDFTDGCKAGANAKQINMILFHLSLFWHATSTSISSSGRKEHTQETGTCIRIVSTVTCSSFQTVYRAFILTPKQKHRR